MSQSNNKGKHLTLENREFIQTALEINLSLQEIASHLGKDSTTISKEIKRNRTSITRNPDKVIKSCIHRGTCKKQNSCGKNCGRLCKKCSLMNCYRICDNYTESKCSKVQRFPHVCNGCLTTVGCKHARYRYRASVAQASYTDTLRTSREGIDLSQRELKKLDEVVTPLVMKGQSLKHIHVNHQEELGCSQRTLYNYFDMNLFTARNVDLPRKVKFRPRKKKKKAVQKDQAYKIGRTYEDFLVYMSENPEVPIVEMDTVYGKAGEPAILTLMFTKTSLMLGFLLNSRSIDCVTSAINGLYEKLGRERFTSHLPLLLTDNGSEFKGPELIEFDSENQERSRVYYCEPYASYQKPHVEKNHTYIRRILPKGSSFKYLTQDKVTQIMNHVNSTARESLDDLTPFALAKKLYGMDFLNELGLKLIPPNEVHLKPSLLKQKN